MDPQRATLATGKCVVLVDDLLSHSEVHRLGLIPYGLLQPEWLAGRDCDS